MKSKIKIFQKTYFTLLLLFLSFFVVNLKIYASENFEIVNYEGMEFVHFLSTNFFIEKNLYDEDPSAMTKEILSQEYEDAKELIHDTTGLNYDCDSKIYIVPEGNTNILTEDAAGSFSHSENSIQIHKPYFFNEEYLAHEMVHSINFNTFGEAKIFGGFDEAIAGQTASWFAPIDSNSTEPLDCFPDKGGMVSSLGQHMIKDWKDQQGEGVISKWHDKVKNGTNQIQAFFDLGGRRIAAKHGCLKDLNVRSSLYKELEPFAGNNTRSIIRDFINKNGQNVTDKIVDLSDMNKDYRDAFIELGGNEIAKEYGCEVKPSNRYLNLAGNVGKGLLTTAIGLILLSTCCN